MSVYLCFFFFNQKTAYELRISDWSSDVCSSDLFARFEDIEAVAVERLAIEARIAHRDEHRALIGLGLDRQAGACIHHYIGIDGRTMLRRRRGRAPQAAHDHPRRKAGHGDRKSTRLNSSH